MALCFPNITAETGLFTSLFLAGLAGGFTHCAGMCSPFVMAQISESSPGTPWIKRLAGAALVPYHLGRITTYVLMAVIFSTVLNGALLFSPLKGLVASMMLLAAALIFLSNIIPAVGKIFPYLAGIRLPVPQDFIMNLARPIMARNSAASRYALGLLLGFMPCGMVIAAIMTVVALDSPAKAALGMGLFALGTVPALMLVAMGGHIMNASFPQTAPAIKFTMLMLSSAVLIMTAGKMLLS